MFKFTIKENEGNATSLTYYRKLQVQCLEEMKFENVLI